MKRISTITLGLLLLIAFSLPASASAATNPGIKPGSFFYFFDTTFEKIGLFFTSSPEKKAKKALKYADERLAEAEAVTENAEAVKTAITNYESNIAFAEEKSKDIGNKEKAEALLTSIADNTSKHQEVLTDVLAKVPDEAKEAITRAIEVSRKGHEEAMQKIAELKGEVEKLKQEVAELKSKDEERGKIIEELNRSKSESISKPTPASIKPTTLKTPENTMAPKPTTPTKVIEPKTTESVVQSPANTTQTPEPTPSPTIQTQSSVAIQISSVNITPSLTSAQIEWQTNILTNSKIFLSGENFSSKVFNSESGLSTRHIVNATGLTSGTTYSYDIEAVAGDQVVKKQGTFSTKPDDLAISLQVDKSSVQYWPNCGNLPFLIQLAGTSGGSCSTDAKVNFEYKPKSLGTHTITATASGVSKSIDIQVTEYVKIDPEFKKGTVYQQDENNSSYPVEIPEYPLGYQNATIVNFNLSDADEPFTLGEIKIESDISTNKLQAFAGSSKFGIFGSGAPLNYNSTLYSIKINDTTGISIGTHTFIVKEIRAIGQKSGLYRTVTGLPLTFKFVIK
jgi:hypothetical protein